MNLTALCALACLLVASPLTAQTDTARKPARVLSHTFASPGREFVRVRLISAESYRVQVNRAQVRLEVRPVSPGVQPPGVRAIFHGDKLSVFLLEPRVSAEYEIRLLGAGDRPARLTVDRREGKP
jgi:hypothetical protein